MRYDEMIKRIANANKSASERCDIVIKDMAKVIEEIINYKYALDHYNGKTDSVITDNANSVKNAVASLEVNMDILKEVLKITDKVDSKKDTKANKIIKRIM